MSEPKYKYSDLTEKIIGCVMRVHTSLGNGFPEVIYQRSLEIESSKACLNFEREIKQDVYYGDQKVGTRVVDFLFEGKVIVEIKAVSEINEQHYSQF